VVDERVDAETFIAQVAAEALGQHERRAATLVNADSRNDADNLKRCLRSELSAIDTYRQALEKHREQYSHAPQSQQLSQMLQEHEDAASRLRSLVQQHGGTPSTDSGAGCMAEDSYGRRQTFSALSRR